MRRLAVVIPLLLLAPAILARDALGGHGSFSAPADTLMLVREWNAEKGFLIGWLPAHCAAIQLELLSRNQSPSYEPDQAVYLTWPRMHGQDLSEAHLKVSPSPRVFEGESWLPVKRDPNLVRIGKCLYLVRGIILNGAKWRRPAKATAAAIQ